MKMLFYNFAENDQVLMLLGLEILKFMGIFFDVSSGLLLT